MKEIRNYSPENEKEFRAFEEDGKKYIEGYASLYNQSSKLITEKGRSFYEVIQNGAFRDVLASNPDVLATINHNRNQMMARTKSGTLSLSEDEKGLKYRFEVPNVSYANDVYELVKRGDMFESSFAFGIDQKNQSFTKAEDRNDIRTISKIDRLWDISVVTDGAYADTAVVARSLEELDEEQKKEEEKKKEEENIIRDKKEFKNDYKTYIDLKYNIRNK